MQRLLCLLLLALTVETILGQEPRCEFQVQFTESVYNQRFTGRVLVYLSNSSEPRLGPNWFSPAPFFAVDVTNIAPGEVITFDHNALGYPEPLHKLPAKEYTVQAVLDLDLANTHRIGSSPGNGYSLSKKVKLDPGMGFKIPSRRKTSCKLQYPS